MNREDFIKKIFKLAVLLNAEMTKEKAQMYWDIFKKYTKEQIERALNLAVNTCKFFPVPAVIIELIEGSPSSKSMMAWEQVYDAIFKHGRYSSVVFSDKVIHKAIDCLGGWQKLCSSSEVDMKWIQKDFERLYQAYQNQPLQNYPAVLAGFHEEHNRGLGVGQTLVDRNGNLRQVQDFIPAPTKIGDGKFLQ